METSPKPVVLFVGAFSVPPGGVIGGQYVACRQLLDSKVSQCVVWQLIDSSMKSLPPPGIAVRSWYALVRVLAVVRRLIFTRVDTVFVFAPLAHIGLLDKGLMCLLGRLLGKRVVISFRSEIRPFRRWRWLSDRFVRAVLRASDVAICQSPMAAEKLVSLFRCDPGRITIIPNWIDTSRYAAVAAARRTRLPNQPPVVLYVGWLEEFKGIFVLADAVGRLARQGRRVRLVFCGSGSHRDELARRCEEHGIADVVDVRGWVDGEKKMAAYAEADVFVLVSQREGLPNALMEAMAAALPAIATPVGGIPSLVDSGQNGLLVPPDRPDELARAIAALLDDPAEARRMAEAGYARIVAEHDIQRLWPRVAAAMIGRPLAGEEAE